MLYKRGGWKKFQKLINGEVPIRAWRVEKVSKINKRASLFIRQVRVGCVNLNKSFPSVIFVEKKYKMTRNLLRNIIALLEVFGSYFYEF